MERIEDLIVIMDLLDDGKVEELKALYQQKLCRALLNAPAQQEFLLCLVEHPEQPMTARQVAEEMGESTELAGQHLLSMTRRRLVSRESPAKGQHGYRYRLTPRGLVIAQQIDASGIT